MNREELKKRLRMKVRQQQVHRINNVAKSQEIDRMRNDIMEEVKETMVKAANDKTIVKNKNKSKSQNKKLKLLEKKYGKITEELYHQTVLRYKTFKYEIEDEKNRDKNIISLYLKQNKDKTENDNNNNKPYEISTKLTTIADKIILDDDDESISSELSI